MGDDNGLNGDVNANRSPQSTGDPQLDTALQQWLAWDKVRGSPACCGGYSPGEPRVEPG